MFNSKKESLFEVKKQSSAGTNNAFINAGVKQAAKTTSLGNGAVKYVTTGNDFVDQFGKITNYKAPRPYAEIDKDMRLLWSQNKIMTVCLLFYIRMITRIVSLFDGIKTSTVQRGQGLKHEGIFRMMWLAINEPNTFWKNITLFISVGSWKDIITMLSYDLQYNGWSNRKLDWEKFGKLILAGLENPNNNQLLLKYLPQIKSNSRCTTVESQADNIIAKWICSLLFGTKENSANYKKYRKLKTSGKAHQWQQLISQHKMLEINFDTIHGRALAQLVSSKFLANQGLEAKYQQWIESKPIAKYTGFVYELLAPVKMGYNNIQLKKYQEDTINKQFEGLLETARKGMNDKSLFLVVVDSSSSMTGIVPGTKVSAYSVAKSMALFFSYLLKGPFQGHFMQFANDAKLIAWKGETPVQRLQNDRCEAYGTTNFQGVTSAFVRMKQQGVPESDFPTGILCISDGCFNNTNNQAETKTMLAYLKQYGFSDDYIRNFKIVLWDIPNNHYGASQTAFEDFADCPNLFHMSGLDPAAVAFIMGSEYNPTQPKNSEELFQSAMNQEVLKMIEI